MAAYLSTFIENGGTFGGYLSVDGQRDFGIKDDMTYELSPGKHQFVVYSKSGAERGTAAVGKWAKANSSSSGKIMNKLEDAAFNYGAGQSWTMTIDVKENQMVILTMTSKGTKIVEDPDFQVIDLEQEQIERLEHTFEEYRNTPRRNKKQMIWGAILLFVGLYCSAYNLVGEGSANVSAEEIPALICVMLGITAVGAILFVFGFRKKIRK